MQWALAYLAAGFVVLQLLDALESALGLTPTVQRVLLIIIVVGFFVDLVVAWYHGEKGRQRVSGPELLMVGALLVVAGVALSFLRPAAQGLRPATAEGDDRPGIAVIPCENWSPHAEDAYFASGVHDEILLHLQRISGLRSVGRESMEYYRQHPVPLRQMARELGVGFLGECSVLKDVDRNQIRVTFQLLDGSTGAQVWAERYDEDLTVRSVFDIHTDIARRVARAVGAVITPEERARLAERPTESTPAFNEYLVGRSWLRQRTGEGFKTALRHFESAIEADSGFALAYVGLADTYSLLASYGHLPARQAFSSARTMAERALKMDGELGEAHAALGYIQERFDWEYEAAFRSFERAVRLNPNYPEAYLWHAFGLTVLGRVEEARPLLERALELDPFNFQIRRVMGDRYLVARDYDRALEQREQVVAMNPDFALARWDLATIHILRGNVAEGLTQLDGLAGEQPSLRRAWGYAVAGRDAEARRILGTALDGSVAVDPVGVAMVYTRLGEPDSAFEWLDRALELKATTLFPVISYPEWDPLRADPRFVRVLERLGAPRDRASR